MFPRFLVWTAWVFISSKGFAHALATGKNHVPTRTPTNPVNRLASVMPQSALANPVGELKYVALGLGTQNYTCSYDDEHAAPGTTGATGTYSHYSDEHTADISKPHYTISADSSVLTYWPRRGGSRQYLARPLS